MKRNDLSRALVAFDHATAGRDEETVLRSNKETDQKEKTMET
jgi:hypothetical protein